MQNSVLPYKHPPTTTATTTSTTTSLSSLSLLWRRTLRRRPRRLAPQCKKTKKHSARFSEEAPVKKNLTFLATPLARNLSPSRPSPETEADP